MMKTRRLRDSKVREEVVGAGTGSFNPLMGWFLPLLGHKRQGECGKGGGLLLVLS